MTDRALVVVPVHGHHDLTHALVRDLQREAGLADVVIVDNGGGYPVVAGEAVVRPGSNLGWAAGTNAGTTEHRRPEHVAVVWLNNDTRLAPAFVAGLVRCWRDTGAGLVGPCYDDYWHHQRVGDRVPVDRYRPRRRHFAAPFVDGTCMFVPASTVDAVGLLDADTFGPVGWGAEIDYALRVRAAGLDIAITQLAYLHHERSTTGKTVFEGLEGYATAGYPAFVEGMAAKWGDDWRDRAGLDPETGQTARSRVRLGRWRRRGA